ncbi:MAG: asparaginase [Oscillospiraceae bacterium]|nr:asparaginase [Oscillospiraceae bacterium]
MKKHILLLTTGGTIACRPGDQGLTPGNADALQLALDRLENFYDITVRDVMCLDSSNIRPAEWQRIARCVFESREGFDGVVISHGTDTMAYTASALSFMLPGIDLPVVFTGSQLPLSDPMSDGMDNLNTAFAMAASGKPGVFIAFDRKVMLGCRAVKTSATEFSAFESINARYVAKATSQGLWLREGAPIPQSSKTPALLTDLDTDVFLLKLTPGLSPAIFDALKDLGYKGIVIEAFGLGGMNVLGRGLEGIRRAIDSGICVVVTTQCLSGTADLQVYEVGSRLLELGVIQGRDMTSEAALTKLMWALGQGYTQAEITNIFNCSLAGEITI